MFIRFICGLSWFDSVVVSVVNFGLFEVVIVIGFCDIFCIEVGLVGLVVVYFV